MHRFPTFSKELSEEFHFISQVGDDLPKKSSSKTKEAVKRAKSPAPTIFIGPPIKSDVATEESTEFTPAVSHKDEGFIPLSSISLNHRRKVKVAEVIKEPDYFRLMKKDLQNLRLWEEKVRSGEMPLTDELKRKFIKARINISLDSSSSSGSDLVEMSEETKNFLDAEFA